MRSGAFDRRLRALGLELPRPSTPGANYVQSVRTGDLLFLTGHSQVINGASDLFVEVLGEAGRHTRIALGVAGLPYGVAVEVEATFEVR